MSKYLIEIPDGIVPKGYTPVAYMPVKEGEELRGFGGYAAKALCDVTEPHLVIEKIKTKRLIFELVCENKRPELGEYFQDCLGNIAKWEYTTPSITLRKIYRLVEE